MSVQGIVVEDDDGNLAIEIKEEEKKFWYKIEDSLYDEKEEENKERYKQLEFDFEEDQVAPI